MYYEEKKGGHLKMIYEDNGVGVPQAAKPKLFDEGYTTGKGLATDLSGKEDDGSLRLDHTRNRHARQRSQIHYINPQDKPRRKRKLQTSLNLHCEEKEGLLKILR